MELWIRSQDKTTLLKTNDLFLDHKQQKSTISTYSNRGYTIILGFYDNEERCLEILDEIRDLICPKPRCIIKHMDFDNEDEGLIGCNIIKSANYQIEKISDCIVYEMPLE